MRFSKLVATLLAPFVMMPLVGGCNVSDAEKGPLLEHLECSEIDSWVASIEATCWSVREEFLDAQIAIESSLGYLLESGFFEPFNIEARREVECDPREDLESRWYSVPKVCSIDLLDGSGDEVARLQVGGHYETDDLEALKAGDGYDSFHLFYYVFMDSRPVG